MIPEWELTIISEVFWQSGTTKQHFMLAYAVEIHGSRSRWRCNRDGLSDERWFWALLMYDCGWEMHCSLTVSKHMKELMDGRSDRDWKWLKLTLVHDRSEWLTLHKSRSDRWRLAASVFSIWQRTYSSINQSINRPTNQPTNQFKQLLLRCPK